MNKKLGQKKLRVVFTVHSVQAHGLGGQGIAHCSKPWGSAPGRDTSGRTLAAEGRAKGRPTATSKGRTGRKVSLGASHECSGI